MWLVKEGGFDTTTSEVWWRPATHFSQELELQYQSNIGLQEGEVQYDDKRGTVVTHYYTHDLRRDHCWLQHRYGDADRTRMKHKKQIIRVIVG